jgi:hypothetical protein
MNKRNLERGLFIMPEIRNLDFFQIFTNERVSGTFIIFLVF